MAKIIDKRYMILNVSSNSTAPSPVKNAIQLDNNHFIVQAGTEIIIADEDGGGLGGNIYMRYFNGISGDYEQKPVPTLVPVTTYTEEHEGLTWRYYKFVLPYCDGASYSLA